VGELWTEFRETVEDWLSPPPTMT